ncbi:fungal-specific transcription factor domain-containing protein [Xylaria cubensis]|nr:fungal-specific transcription factor domain-containing protein [Xylaria cubensis]
MPRQRNRTFTGCWKCRQRKVKCDEGRPGCLSCQRIGVACAGYDPKYIWVEDDGQTYKSAGRRILDCEKTWKGFRLLSSDQADHLISECDMHACVVLVDGPTSSQPAPHNPFSVFSAAARLSIGRRTEASQLPQAMALFPGSTWVERMLFHHYVTHVAGIMMPYEHPRNPWKLYYPATALSCANADQQALYNAMLAQAAFNLAHLRGFDEDILTIGSKYYYSGIEKLLSITRGQSTDFGAMSASIMTIMFSEIYNGKSSTWRHHLEGAWSLFKEYRDSEPWRITDFVCVSIQSLNIVKIISATSQRDRDLEFLEHDSEDDDFAVSELVSTTSGFGFTIGASQAVLDCISIISQARVMRERGNMTLMADDLLEDVLSRLNKCRLDETEANEVLIQIGAAEAQKVSTESRSQSSSFIYSTYIYLYRTILDVPPKAVKTYVSKTLQEVSIFLANSNGNFSLWPAFIAATEAYTYEDLLNAKRWLDWATSFGIGSRTSARRVIEEVWRRRETLSCSSGLDPGMISIDWREVMHELNCDILLI